MVARGRGWDPSLGTLGPCGGWRGAEDGGQAGGAVQGIGKRLAPERRPAHTRKRGRAWDGHWWAQTPLAPGVWCLLPHRQLFPNCFQAPPRAPGLARCRWGWPAGFGCREIAAYLGEELKKYIPKGYSITGLKHRVLQKVHRGGVRVINDNFSSSRQCFFFPSRKTLILLIMLTTACVAKGTSPGAVTCPSSFACRGHATHFREGEPKLPHPELAEAGHVLPEKGSEFRLCLEGSLSPGISWFVGLW